MSVFLSSWALISWNSPVHRLSMPLNQLEWKAQSGMVVADPRLLLLVYPPQSLPREAAAGRPCLLSRIRKRGVGEIKCQRIF
jgi:hypothetical protein